MDSVLEGRNTLALMATGAGKSLCYQVPGLILDGLVVVISPLIALMEDQVEGLKKRNIKAIAIHSGFNKKRQDELLDNIVYDEQIKFVFLSPEKFSTRIVQTRLLKRKLAFFTIDEAHCISQWGHDFRPNYQKLNIIRENFPNHAILALTATATQLVVKDILNSLGINQNSNVLRSSFKRENISISLIKTNRKLYKIEYLLSRIKGSKIIYARNKRHCHEINDYLTGKGIKSSVYHADIPAKNRIKRQGDWLKNELECMVCTSAFGMGIDKPDVRLVIHFDVPPNLEEYLQEIGRAGRDGKRSFAVMLYNNFDLEELTFHFENSIVLPKKVLAVYRKLAQFLEIPIGEGKNEEYYFDLNEFLLYTKLNKSIARNLLKTLEYNGYIEWLDQDRKKSSIKIIAKKSEINTELLKNDMESKLLKILLRNYEGVLREEVELSFNKLAERLEIDVADLRSKLSHLERKKLLVFQYAESGQKIKMLTERLPNSNVKLDHEMIRLLNKMRKMRYASIMDYVHTACCRSEFLLAYFGENQKEECGICDYCLGAFDLNFSKEEFLDTKTRLDIILEKGGLSLDKVLANWPWNRQNKVKKIIQTLLDEGQLQFFQNELSIMQKSKN